MSYNGGCYCGKVRFELTGPVQSAQVCHCSICRHLQSSSLGQLASFFKKEDFNVTEGKDFLNEFVTPLKYSRKFCKECGTRIGISFEKADFDVPFVVVYPTTIDELKNTKDLPNEFKPQRHIFYADRLYDQNDGVMKFADMPKEFGGSGKMLDHSGQEI